jgi:hypothetical protein
MNKKNKRQNIFMHMTFFFLKKKKKYINHTTQVHSKRGATQVHSEYTIIQPTWEEEHKYKNCENLEKQELLIATIHP